MGISFTLALIMMLAKNVSGQTTSKSEEAPFDFQSNLKGLQEVLFLFFIGVNGPIPIVTVMHEKIDEGDSAQASIRIFEPQFFQEITTQDIQEVTKEFGLLVVEDQFGQPEPWPFWRLAGEKAYCLTTNFIMPVALRM